MKRNWLICTIIGLFAVFQLNAQTSESYSWDNVAIGGGGFVSGIFCSPIEQNVIYNRTDVGGAYRWDETSKTWISMMDWVNSDERGLLGVESLAIDPSIPGAVYMMAGTVYWNAADDGIGRSAFLRSSDYGQTWEAIPVWDNSTKYFNVNGNGMGRGNGERLAVDPSNSNVMFYGSRNKGLWKSTNNGTSWSKVNSFPVDTTWNGCGISFVAYDPANNNKIYAGVYRKANNLFVSEDGGSSWALVPNMPQPTYDGSNSMGLMPQRIAINPDGSAFYLTLGNGAGPHTMQWDEGWGAINDWYNRGALYKYEVASSTWSDISPQNFINPEEDNPWSDPATYFGTYSGISLDPNNPDHVVVSSCASYRGPQFWYVDGTWYDQWGDNIFVSEDGGKNWVSSFQYYWMDGGFYPPAEQMNKNGVEWIERGAIHWISNAVIDPYNPQRVFVNSGNGVWITEDIFNYEWTYEDEWGNPDTSYIQSTEWKFSSHGIEEIVPEDVVSIPGGPLVSVMLDAGGLVHEDLTSSPSTGLHSVSVAGTDFHLGSTTGLAYAPQSGRLVSCARAREVSTQYNTIPIGPVQWSTDNGLTWTTESYTSNPPSELNGGRVGISADGEVTLWMPSEGTVMYRNLNTSWTEVSGINFNGRPVGDQVDENLFYCYDKSTGYMFVSSDKGVSFSQAGNVGASNFRNAVAVPGNEGHVWVPVANSDGTGALMRSSDGGQSFTSVSGVGYCEAVGFGKAASGANYPTVFAFAEIDGVKGVFRSIDQGTSWARVNDDAHEYGGLANGEFVVGDMNVFGRVYMSTAGRGIVYGDPTGSTTPVTGISISPATATVSIGGTTLLNAVISPSNASNQSVNWNSGNSGIASVSSSGLVTGVSAGTVSITATSVDGGYIAVAEVNVASVAVEGVAVTPASVTLDPSETQQLSAIVSPSDATNQNVTWSTSDGSIATVDGDGLVMAISYGTATITATTEEGGYTASSSVSVNFVETPVTGISVSPTTSLLEPDGTTTLESTLEPLYATNQVVYWSSDNESVATVSSDGIVSAISEGVAVITVTTDDGGYTASATISVSTIEFGTILCEYWDGVSGTAVSDLTSSSDYPDNPSRTESLTSIEIPVDQGDSYGTRIRGYIHPTASGSYTFWLAGDDNCELYLSTDANAANITRIAYHEGWTNSQEFDKYATQQSAAVDLVAGQQYYIEALQKEGNGGDNLAVAWEGPGITQSVIGSSYISPFITGGNSAPIASVTATPISGESPLNVSFDAAGSSDPDGDALSYSWDFGDGNTATGVTANNTYDAVGTYTVSVTVSDGSLSDVASVDITVEDVIVPVTGISISPTNITMSLGDNISTIITITPSNATNQAVSYSSGNTSVATVSSGGVISAVGLGSAVITVTSDDGGYTATVDVSVIDETISVTGVSVSPTSVTIDVNESATLSETVAPSDATNQSVSWSSSNSNVATVSSTGVVTGIASGTATITVTTVDGGYTASAAIVVNAVDIPVAGVSVSPTSASISVGSSTTLSAVVNPTNATNQSVSWSSEDVTVASVNSSGVVSGITEGTTYITVTTDDGGYTASATVEVTSGGITPCDNPVTVSLDFSYDGAGEYCWFFEGEIAYVNSWVTNSVTINGVDFTNSWSNSMPEKINGGYYVSYDGSFGWSHFEAVSVKSAEGLTEQNSIKFYPNPFNSSINLVVNNPELVSSIEVFDNLGRVVEVFDQTHIESFIRFGDGYTSGLYFVKISSKTGVETYMINKN